jgi:hypothetical protein
VFAIVAVFLQTSQEGAARLSAVADTSISIPGREIKPELVPLDFLLFAEFTQTQLIYEYLDIINSLLGLVLLKQRVDIVDLRALNKGVILEHTPISSALRKLEMGVFSKKSPLFKPAEVDDVDSLFEEYKTRKGIYDAQIFIAQLGSEFSEDEEIARVKLGFDLAARNGDVGVRDGGKTRNSFLARLRQYYYDCKHRRCKFMCTQAGLLELVCQGLEFGYIMIPVWTPCEKIAEDVEEAIFTVMECTWDYEINRLQI